MSVVFSCVLEESEREMLAGKLTKNVHRIGGCEIWNAGKNCYGYGVVRVPFRGRRVTLTVHRLAYYLSVQNKLLSPKMHVSHLCHNKTCVKIDHLSYEPQSINNARNICFMNARCKGHRCYPNCIFA